MYLISVCPHAPHRHYWDGTKVVEGDESAL
jgi:hypothetical protein